MKKEFSTLDLLIIGHIKELNISKRKFRFDEKLDGIYKSIKESELLIKLQDNWDEEGAIGCNHIVYDRAINILIKYAENVLKYYASVIQPPEINLTKDGSIDLEWRSVN